MDSSVKSTDLDELIERKVALSLSKYLQEGRLPASTFDDRDRYDTSEKRFEDMNNHMNRRFDDMNNHMNRRFDDTNKRIDDMNKQFDRLIRTLKWLFVFGITIVTVLITIYKFV